MAIISIIIDILTLYVEVRKAVHHIEVYGEPVYKFKVMDVSSIVSVFSYDTVLNWVDTIANITSTKFEFTPSISRRYGTLKLSAR